MTATTALTSPAPRSEEIDCNFLAGDRDACRMLEGVKLARKIGGKPALAQFELEIMPGCSRG
jgi:hypothetical protein